MEIVQHAAETGQCTNEQIIPSLVLDLAARAQGARIARDHGQAAAHSVSAWISKNHGVLDHVPGYCARSGTPEIAWAQLSA